MYTDKIRTHYRAAIISKDIAWMDIYNLCLAWHKTNLRKMRGFVGKFDIELTALGDCQFLAYPIV